jgi:hypothetical protein
MSLKVCNDCGSELRTLLGPNWYCSNECDLYPERKRNPCAEVSLDLSLYAATPLNARGVRFYIRAKDDINNVNRKLQAGDWLWVSTTPNWGSSKAAVQEIQILGRFNYDPCQDRLKKIVGEPILAKWK